MKRVYLKSLKLVNFKIYKSKNIDFTKGTNVLEGRNGIGKTSIFDAYTFVLLGKNSENRTDRELKHNKASKEESFSVEAELTVDGELIVLKREISEKWVRSKGMSEPQFKGNETSFFIDGVPVKKSEFDSKVSEIFEMKFFELFSNVGNFHNDKVFPTEKRRQLIMELVNDSIDVDSLKNKWSVDPLSKDKRKSELKSKQKELKDQVSKIPVKIEENASQIIEGKKFIEVTEFETKISEIKEKQRSIDKANQIEIDKQVQSENELSGLKNQLSRKKSELETAKIELENIINSNNNAESIAKQSKQNEIDSLNAKISSVNSEIARKQNEISELETLGKQIKEKAVLLANQYKAFDERKVEVTENCSCCGQILPPEKISEAREIAVKNAKQPILNEYNKRKDEVLSIKEKIDSKNEEINVLSKKTKYIDSEIKVVEDRQIEITLKDTNGQQQKIDSLISEIEKLQQTVDEFKVYQPQEVKESFDYTDELKSLEQSIKDAQENNAVCTENQRKQIRISELRNEQTKLNDELGTVERELMAIENFEFDLMSETKKQVDSLFDGVTFEMFKENIGEGFTNVCYAVENGLSYYDRSNSQQINLGTKIIEGLSKRIGIQYPLFIDDSEGVLNPVETELQTIYLHAKDVDSNF